MFRIRKCLPDKIKKIMYYAFVHTHLTFLSNIWGHCTQSNMDRLRVTQKRCLKILFNFHPLTPSVDLYKHLEITPIDKLVKIKSALFIFKVKKGILHVDFPLVFGTEVHQYDTRAKNLLRMMDVPRTNKYSSNGVVGRSSEYFNKIEVDLTKCSVAHIKRRLKEVFS